MIWKKRALSCVLAILFLHLAEAEKIRGLLSGVIDLADSQLESREFSLGLEELMAIIPGEKAAFLSKVELILQIPPPIRLRADSFILLVYKMISPAPGRETYSYEGLEEAHFVLPNRSRFYINIPISQEGKRGVPRKNGPDTLNLSQPLGEEDFPLLLTLLPLSKGVPPKMDATSLSIKAVPSWNNRGALAVSFTPDEILPESVSMTIDGEAILWQPELILPTGIYALEAEAEGYRRTSMSIVVQEAKTTHIEVPMVLEKATLSFDAPDQAIVFLDGERIDIPFGSPMRTEAGSHTVTVLLDNYRVTKQFSLNSGENLKISLFLDILIQDN